MARLAAEGVPAGPVHRVDEVLASPQAEARHMVQRLKSRSGEELLLLGCPIKLAEGEPALGAPPALGQHTDEVLAGLLGYDTDRIQRLRRERII